MKILCVIDSLGSGGAQRQLVNLALAFKDKVVIPPFIFRGDYNCTNLLL